MNEIKRIYVLQQVIDQKMTGPEAAQRLGISLRQARRLLAKYQAKGAPGMAHGNRGRVPHNRVEATVRQQIQKLSEKEYADYNDSHFTEELLEKHGLQLSRSTVRRIRREAGQKSPRKHRSPHHRSRRERRSKAGMLLQTDGSQHAWLEDRGPVLTLIAYIDDATNQVSGAIFREQEDATGYMLGLCHVCLTQGIPLAIYADRHTIFQNPSKTTLEQELGEEPAKSQYGRLLDELGIELIAAQSPQAKGRIERLWGTLQDRLVKALRQAGATNLEQANQVLTIFIPKFNRRFQIEPEDPDSAYLPWPTMEDVNDYFCFKYTRTVTNDNTISFAGHHLQIPPGLHRHSYARAKVDLRQHLDGRLEVRYQGQSLVIFQPAHSQLVRVNQFIPASAPIPLPQPVTQSPQKKTLVTYPHKPAANHPWRRYPLSIRQALPKPATEESK